MPSPQRQPLTSEEYLALERESQIRSEYISGQMRERSGVSLRHSTIVTNIVGGLWSQTRGKGCHVHANDLRVKVSLTGTYTYPDVVAFCGEARLEDEHHDTLLNPAVIIEVLSPSTEAYDRGEKFAQYRRIDSLREYALITQDKVAVEYYWLRGANWVMRDIEGPDATLRLESIDCQLSVAAIYEGVELNYAKGC